MAIKYIRVTITPEQKMMHSSGRIVHELLIDVHDYDMGSLSFRELLPDDEFESRFDYIFDRAKNEIRNRIFKARNGGR